MYICRHFAIHELVPPKALEERGEKAWELLDERLLITLDNLRKRYGKMTVNNYYWDGPRMWSGLRTPESPQYRPFSQHSFGRAADCLFADQQVEAVRQEIINRPTDSDFELIGGIELEVEWLHVDIRNCERIKTFRP